MDPVPVDDGKDTGVAGADAVGPLQRLQRPGVRAAGADEAGEGGQVAARRLAPDADPVRVDAEGAAKCRT